jgi:hypothetical protein
VIKDESGGKTVENLAVIFGELIWNRDKNRGKKRRKLDEFRGFSGKKEGKYFYT